MSKSKDNNKAFNKSPYKRRFFPAILWRIKINFRDAHAHVVIGDRKKGKRFDEYMSLLITTSPKHKQRDNAELADNPRSKLQQSLPSQGKSYVRKDLNYGPKKNYGRATVGKWRLNRKNKKIIKAIVKEKKKTGG